MLTLLTMSVVQLALALHVRNTLIDSAAEGARFAALADTELAEGVDRTRALIGVAVGRAYAEAIEVSLDDRAGARIVTVSVVAPLPVLGLIGAPGLLEVRGHAVLEELA
ncbi:pilus assembly protein [Plantibacter flavus]